MRLLELAVAVLTVAAAVASTRAPRPWLAALATLGAVAVVVVGRGRWQLVPAALGLGMLVGVTALQLGWPDAATVGPRVTAAVVVLGVVTSAALAWALPLPRIRLAAGSGPVGTVAFDLVDPTRSSPAPDAEADAPRVTPVQVWYPAAQDVGPHLRVTDDPRAFADAVSRFLGLPAFALTHLGGVTTSARVGAPIDAAVGAAGAPGAADGGLPVVLSLHGWGGFRFAQAPLLEQLAADGHLVLAMDHTHGAVASQPVSGGVIPIEPLLLPDDAPPPVYDAAATRLERLFADDALALLAALRRGVPELPVDVLPAEVLATADLDRVIVLGHSTGGGAGVLLCREDPGCRALVGFDPWVEPLPPDVRAAGFPAPTTVLLSQEWDGNDNDRLLGPMLARGDDARRFVLDGTTHRDVTVEARLSPLSSRLGIAGPLSAERTDEIVLAVTRAAIADAVGSGPGDPSLLDDPPFPELRR